MTERKKGRRIQTKTKREIKEEGKMERRKERGAAGESECQFISFSLSPLHMWTRSAAICRGLTKQIKSKLKEH